MGVVPPEPGFLGSVQNFCRRYGSLLIFDEVMTGFRLAYGGAQEKFGIIPDLTTLGKIVGGGLPVGAYGGRAEVMQKISPVGPVYQAGTLSGNPLAMAAGIATLKILKRTNPYDRLEAETTRLVQGLADAASAAGVSHTLNHVGSMFTLFFHGEPVRNLADAMQCDTGRFAKYFWGMIDRGVYLPCSQFEANFLSATHSPSDIDTTISAAREALRLGD
jgi:glutamate-1-semialdehyde 2,1-aminomutase